MNLYTYAEAARLLSLSGRAAVFKRLRSLAARGEPLTVEAGELLEVGERLMLTEAGLDRLRNFTYRKLGRPAKAAQAGSSKQ